jgi:carboxypeptidase Taq
LKEKFETLQAKLKDIKNLHNAKAVLGWDQQVFMPPGGAEARAEQLATLSRLAHDMFVADDIGALLEDLARNDFPYDSDEAGLVRVARRDYDLARKLPSELVEKMNRTYSLGQQIWARSRANKRFDQFQDILNEIVDLNIQEAEALGYDTCLYDALLDENEPGIKTSEVRKVFDAIKSELVPLVEAIAKQGSRVDDSFLKQEFDETAQWDFGMMPLKAIGFDFNRGRQDKSVHPFTTSFSINDVRITTRVFKDQFPSALFSTLHEGGHALYDQSSAPSLEGTFLAGGTSMGVHESQSRLWENVLGRSRAFWQFYYPQLQKFFPAQLGSIGLEKFYRAVNRVAPSLIRVEADELTYNLHIFLRFELEQDLLERRLRVSDLPDAWNAKMEAYLGLTPPDDAMGVLQDIHWSVGSMGYFPTYTLGNVLSLQFYQQALKEIPGFEEQFSKGKFDEFREWFKQKIHMHGRKFTAAELLRRITGEKEMDARPYLDYIKRKYSEIYDLP